MSTDEDKTRDSEKSGSEEKPEEESGEVNGERATSSRLWTPYSEPDRGAEKQASGPSAGEGEEMSEEEMRKRLEEAMEKITVADVAADMIITLTSLAYRRMGIPKEVNEKYKDMPQAKQAVDLVEAMTEVLKGILPEDTMKPFISSLDSLKLNFAKES